MKLEVLGCSGGLGKGARLSSYLIDDRLLIDAGHLSGVTITGPEAMLLTHAHLDHVQHLPMFITSRMVQASETFPIHAEADTIRRVRTGLMADDVYPDHSDLPTLATGRPTAAWHPVQGVPFQVLDYEVTPLTMVHAYPCVSYAIRRGTSGIIVGGDTWDSRPLWAFASANPWVKAVLVECSFYNGSEAVCESAGHLNPDLLAEQLRGFRRRSVDIHITHIKPECAVRVRRELTANLGTRATPARAGDTLQV